MINSKFFLGLTVVILWASCEKKPNDRYIEFNGKKQHILDLGEGEPTVVFITGLNCGLQFFDSVQREVSKITRTLSYDRSGLGKSDILDSLRTIEQMTEELNRILLYEKFKEPYILVGHSYGGAVARYFVHKYPDKTAGIVFVDCANDEEFLDSLIMTNKRTREELYSIDTTATKGEQLEMKYVQYNDSILRHVGYKTTIPTHLLIATNIPGFPQDLMRIRINTYKEFNKDAPQMKYIYTERSGHHIQQDEPGLVIKSIKEVMNEVMANRR
jgi:pimeloyl-ACP methyl ester carboxylesterase